MAEKKKPSRLAKALLETAVDMRKAGLLDRATYDKITIRHLGPKDMPKVVPISAEQIPDDAGTREHEPGSVRPLSEPDRRLCLAARAGQSSRPGRRLPC